jgi:hypothetical protein
MLGLFAAVARSQGTADAFAAKIPAANIPSTVMLSAAAAAGAPGQSVQVPVSLSLAGTAPSSFQIDLSFDATKLTFVAASAGAQLTAAGLGLTASAISSGQVRLTTTGASQNGISPGLVATATFTISSSPGTASMPVTLANCMSGGASGSRLSTGCTPGTVAVAACNVTGDATVGVADVQAILNQALGVLPPAYDLNQDGVVNLIDVQLVINAAMGRGCAL